MSLISNPTGFSYTAVEATEYIIIPVLDVSNLDDFFKVITGVNTRQQVIYQLPISKITRRDPGCTVSVVNRQIQYTEKFWTPYPVEALVSQCYADVNGTNVERLLRPGTKRPELVGTQIEETMLKAVVPAAAADLLRMVWLADRAIVGSQLGNGAADVENYNQADGFWKKLVAAAAAGKTPRYVIDENSKTTTADQQLAPGRGKAILRAVYYNQDPVMANVPDAAKRFFVDKAIWNNYYDDLEGNQQLESNRKLLVDGESELYYRGILLEVVTAVDQALFADFKFGAGANTTITNPHRVCLTVDENLQVSLDTQTALPIAFDSWDEKLQKTWYGRMNYMLDTQIALENYCSIAI